MPNYTRLVSYIYNYEEGIKRNNVGYARVEVRNGQCKCFLHITAPSINDKLLKAYLFKRREGGINGILLGTFMVKNGVGEFKIQTDSVHIMNSPYDINDMGGIILYLSDSKFFATEWDDIPITKDVIISMNDEEKGTKREVPQREKAAAADLVERKEEPQSVRTSHVSANTSSASKVDIPKQNKDEKQLDMGKIKETQNIPDNSLGKTPQVLKDSAVVSKASEVKIFPAQRETSTISEKQTVKESPTSYKIPASNIMFDLKTPSYQNGKQEINIPNMESAKEKNRTVNAVESEDKVKLADQDKFDRRDGYDRREDQDGDRRNEYNRNVDYDRRDEYDRNIDHNRRDSELREDFDDRDNAEEREDFEDSNGNMTYDRDFDNNQESEGWDNEKEIEDNRGDKKDNKFYTKSMFEDHPLARRIYKNFPRMYPFEDNDVAWCVRIEPQDIGLFPMEAWVLGNNSFLLHGFYSYRHLIFARINDRNGMRYILGVPGIYHNREKFMAKMFGFENFKCIKRKELKTGEFGYWYIPISLN